ncbi:MAG: hypothetical protein WA719_04915, partial [Thermoplasmata archaeon]
MTRKPRFRMRSLRTAAGGAIAVLAVTVLLALPLFGAPASTANGSSGGPSPASLAAASAFASPHPNAVAVAATPTLPFSSASAGSVVETAYVNYNATTPGNFPSAVWDWAAGKPALDPTTDELWIPQWPISVRDIPMPVSAPALVYDPATNQTQMVQNLTNTSSVAYDPLDGYLYATNPVTDTVEVLNPVTEKVAHAPIPVGLDPDAIVFDSYSGDLYVANGLSANVTVVNGYSNTVTIAGISVGSGPVALADDPLDHQLFVATVTAPATVWNISTYSNKAGEVVTRLTNAPSSLAFSISQDLLAVGMPGSTRLDLFDGATLGPTTTVTVGLGVTSIATNLNGTEFVLANNATSSTDLTVVNGSAGTVVTDHLPVGSEPALLTADPTSGLVYSWSGVYRTVTSVNMVALSDSQLSPDLGVRAGPLAYDSGSGLVYVSDSLSNSVAVLNATTLRTSRAPITVPGTPQSVVDDPATGTVYVGYPGGVLSINGTSGTITQDNPSLPGNNSQLVVDEASNLLWDVNHNSGLESLRLPALSVATVVGIGVGTVGIRGVVLDNETNDLFVVNLTGPTLNVVDGTTGQVVGSPISGMAGLISVAYDSADQMIYALGRSVWIVDPTSLAIIGGPVTIAPHVADWSIVYDPSREFLYIASNSSPAWPGNLTVIDGSSVTASEGAYLAMPLGQLSVDLQPVLLPGSSAPGASEIWVDNYVSG